MSVRLVEVPWSTQEFRYGDFYDEVEYSVLIRCSEGEPATRDYPGSPPQFEFVSVRLITHRLMDAMRRGRKCSQSTLKISLQWIPTSGSRSLIVRAKLRLNKTIRIGVNN